MNRRFGIGVFALCAAAGILGAARAFACSTPVFRYALERWPADPYEIVVTHRGALEGEAKQASDALDAAYRDAEETANIYPRFEDLSGGGAEGAAKSNSRGSNGGGATSTRSGPAPSERQKSPSAGERAWMPSARRAARRSSALPAAAAAARSGLQAKYEGSSSPIRPCAPYTSGAPWARASGEKIDNASML